MSLYCLLLIQVVVACATSANGYKRLPQKNIFDHADFSTCGKDKGCILSPPNCNVEFDCSYALTYSTNSPSQAYASFELAIQLSRSSPNMYPYVAVTLARDEQMTNASTIACYQSQKNAGIALIKDFDNDLNGPLSKPTINQNNQFIILDEVKEVDGLMMCRFRQIAGPDDYKNRIIPLNSSSFRVKFFHGAYDVEGENLQVSDESFTVADTVDLISAQLVNANETVKDPVLNLKKAHGITMIIGWWIFIINGVLIARYFKTVMVKEVAGARLWFNLHRVTTMVGVLLTIAGLIITLIGHKGQWAGNKPGPPGVHSILGLTAIIAGFMNPVMALFRCDPGTGARPIFNWAHRTVGALAWVTASASIFELTKDPFRFDLQDSGRLGSMPKILMYVYFVVLGFIILVLEELQASYDGKTMLKPLKIYKFWRKNEVACGPSTSASVSEGEIAAEPPSKGPKLGMLRIASLVMFNAVGVSITIIEAVIIGQAG